MQSGLEELKTGALRLQTIYEVSSHQSENTGSSQENGWFSVLIDIKNNNLLSFSVQSEAKWFSYILASLKFKKFACVCGGNQIRENT